MMTQLRPWQLSFFFHAGLAIGCLVIVQLKVPTSETIDVPVEIVGPAQEVQNLSEVKDKPKVVLKSVNEPVPESGTKREVFGASRNSYTDESVGAEGVAAKKGNTLAKAADKTVLLDSDADALPTPTEEYLVSQMPTVLTEVRPAYPKEAREKELEGSVVMDILIDAQGKVRDISVVDGDPLFRPGAVEALRKFLFRPAMVDGKSVAVRIRYSLKFQLEY